MTDTCEPGPTPLFENECMDMLALEGLVRHTPASTTTLNNGYTLKGANQDLFATR